MAKHMKGEEFNIPNYDFPNDPREIGKFVEEKIAEKVPPECQRTLKCELEYEDCYGSISTHLNITWDRPETKDEKELRLYQTKNRRRRQEEEERSKLAELKEKYGE